MDNKERERIVKELREQGIVPTDDRLAILKEKIEARNTPSRDRFRCLDLIRQVLHRDADMDIEEWFKELVSLTDDVIRSKQYVKRNR